MSQNINIVATGHAIFPNGKTYPIREEFNCIPTPTKITEEIERSDDPIASYISYLSTDIEKYDIKELVHGILVQPENRTPHKVSRIKIVNYRKKFIKELIAWVALEKEKGLTVEVYGS